VYAAGCGAAHREIPGWVLSSLSSRRSENVWQRRLPVPDGPPLSRAELASFRAQLAEDVEEAYGAVYTEEGTHLISVNAVRFKKAPVPDGPNRTSISGGSVRLARGRTVVVVFGQGGCFDAIAAYVTDVMGL
jgi:hypothetical protein